MPYYVVRAALCSLHVDYTLDIAVVSTVGSSHNERSTAARDDDDARLANLACLGEPTKVPWESRDGKVPSNKVPDRIKCVAVSTARKSCILGAPPSLSRLLVLYARSPLGWA